MDRLSLSIVALGANLPSADGSASETLGSALSILHAEQDISISAASRIWQTPAYPPGSGPDYANAVVLVRSRLAPEALLVRLHAIEARMGRDRGTGRWSARVLDLDLIAVGNLVRPDSATQRAWVALPPARQAVEAPDRLILPHPRLQDRGFVLAPLAEIAPHWCHPLTGRSVAGMLADLGAQGLAGMSPLTAQQGLAQGPTR
ncbi:2-amino-4-hydroxy-6-hydroxymethyldihydropteridine diphosphokinase [Paracoccus spongiarum]|uniref:2-amino-4-hydroxy-6-hydroxymethyldihydropteridine pyrophosphokinase n=1 Tax=Paracoccus spongiarum TaxID=3064387 RepID=A0ABT9JAD3_9RHOB|nr:2-amino-4-hydroxy-6-hydroxymethyldihydropteridine diphosphokinase [Paracoccus sp. 2205BS29-5]MDP5306775.1 2-amino-4-hydroxy-6-hydroxymethyldihydropteridine diphosphokinase [Paracoccus sp. 2205BS29-5]